MALPSFPEPEIIPAGAGTAEIKIDTEHQLGFTDQYGKFYCNPSIIKATPNPGFEFDRFEWDYERWWYEYREYQKGTGSYNFANELRASYFKFNGANLDPPFEAVVEGTSGNFVAVADIAWNGPYIHDQPQYRIYNEQHILGIRVYFKGSPVGNGQIIYGDDGAILCSNKSDGMPLYDDGTDDHVST